MKQDVSEALQFTLFNEFSTLAPRLGVENGT